MKPDTGRVYAMPSKDVLDKRLLIANRPGEHLWALTAAWRVTDPASVSDPSVLKLLDSENMIIFGGPGCLKCDESYSPTLSRRCDGDL
jgi:hypothetical protein